ncbi:hypothetical protein Trydic_g801 [Trypoxylus dichotomus]
MDTNIGVIETVTSSIESDVPVDTTTHSITNEGLVFHEEKGLDAVQTNDIPTNEYLHNNTMVISVMHSEANIIKSVVDNTIQSVDVETEEVITSGTETMVATSITDDSINCLDTSLNSSSNASDITGKYNDNMQTSNDVKVGLISTDQTNQKRSNEIESTSLGQEEIVLQNENIDKAEIISQNENIDKEEIMSQNENIDKEQIVTQNKEDTSLEKLIESSMENINLSNSNDQIVETNSANVLSADATSRETDVSLRSVSNENIQQSSESIHPQIILEGVELVQDVNTDLEKLETVEEQIQSIHCPDLQKENISNDNISVIIDQEFSTAIQESEEATEKNGASIEDITVQENANDNNSSDIRVLDTTSNNAVSTAEIETILIDDNNEKTELSSIKKEQQPPTSKSKEAISIAEAISRDFDEIDCEDDKPETSKEEENVKVSHDGVGVNISEQLQQHGAVTVTDTTGQIYYVQSVEDLIVVENDIPTSLEQPDTIEVTVLSEIDDPEGIQEKHLKSKEKPPMPSHILGRNIDNPVIDTFRNGKVPPKPRLGVKIPYKNLTSQIVSKDELAQEILERQKQKYKRLGQTTREMLFAKQLTQRLAKKIAPTEVPINTVEKVTVATARNDDTINNSDLLAILEGDGEDSEQKKNQDASGISSTESNSSGSSTGKILSTVKESTLKKTETDRKQKLAMSKMTEREIALRQLKELPVGTKRRQCKATINDSFEVTVIENELNLESGISSRNTSVQNDENLVKKLEAKTNSSDNLQPMKAKANVEQKKASESLPGTSEIDENILKRAESEVKQQTHSEDKKSTTKAELAENSNIKTLENRQTSDNEQIILIDSSKLKNDVKQKAESHTETKDVDQKLQVTDVAVTPHSKTNQITSSVNSKSSDKSKKSELPIKPHSAKATEGKVNDPLSKEEFIERKHIGNPPIKTYTRKRKSTEDVSLVSSVPDKKIAVSQRSTGIPPNTYITKSSRIIKRKVIWDPDEPSTARSLATRSPKADSSKLERPIKSDATLTKVDRKPITKTIVKPDVVRSPTKSPDSQKIKKRLSEVDKLLMDEGAVNMLYAVKNVDDATKKKKINVISLDKAQKELLNKTNELKKDLKTNSDKISPKSLRRKDSPIPTPTKKIVPASVSRKKSKDSSRSSLHSPPSSPSMMYSNHAEASRIIRRHSSSSYSSMEGDFDVDKKVDSDAIQTSVPVNPEKVGKKRIAPGGTEGVKLKKVKRSIDKESVTTGEGSKTDEETSKHFNKLIEIQDIEFKYDKYKTFSVKQIDRMVQIILLPSFNNEAYLTPEVLNELCCIMKELRDDTDCTVVVISSSASSFCHGINYKTLLGDKEQGRKTFARKLATCVTNFLRVLATFPKILVAGVHGDTVGVGVTVLPLFDMVIASDTATFSIPNARLGCAAEGGSLLSLPHLMHNVLVSELLYASRKLIAAEALRLGMVTRVLWPDKFQQELVSIVKTISNQSPQFMALTKKQLRQHMLEHIEEALNKEVDTLVQHWTSEECQKNFEVILRDSQSHNNTESWEVREYARNALEVSRTFVGDYKYGPLIEGNSSKKPSPAAVLWNDQTGRLLKPSESYSLRRSIALLTQATSTSSAYFRIGGPRASQEVEAEDFEYLRRGPEATSKVPGLEEDGHRSPDNTLKVVSRSTSVGLKI